MGVAEVRALAAEGITAGNSSRKAKVQGSTDLSRLKGLKRFLRFGSTRPRKD